MKTLDFPKVDSLSYSYYMKGDWDKLITLGKQAIESDIDYKRLRQRIGYAYFVKLDYFAAKNQYEKALAFDGFDTDSRVFLYYCGINLGDEDFARYHGAKLSDDIKQSLDLQSSRWMDAIDLEYNKKTNNSDIRSNPTYTRFGLNSQLGYRFSLYQSVSNYSQVVNDSTQTSQNEYYALGNYSLTANTSMSVGYHYLSTGVQGTIFPTNLYYGGVKTKIGRFNFGLNGSWMKNDMGKFKQINVSGGVVLPVRSNIYLNSTLSRMQEAGNNRFVYSQSVGGQLLRTVWAEGSITLGDIKNYNDHNALYVYNSLDATTFRTGLTLFWNVSSKIILFGNYSFDKKEIDDNNTITNYNQQSFLGGIRWKL
ncbi:MAG: tetratricopeptide repeat protein [Bacteroidales bacterium]